MNFGMIIRNSLVKAELPTNDSEHLNLAKSYGNNNIFEIWYKMSADWRTSRDSITTVANSDEYILNKLFDGFVRNTLRGGSDNPRVLRYKSPDQFFRLTAYDQDATGDPYTYTFGDMVGFDKQIESGTSPTVESSLASKTENNVNVVAGSNKIKSDFNLFDLNDVGQRFQRDGDDETYKIGRFVNESEIELTSKYRGVSGNNLDYRIGDIGIHVNIQGFVGGQIDSEDVTLNGSTKASCKKTFTVITSVSKSDLTAGRIIAKSGDGTLVIATLAPSELEVERQTIRLYTIPDSAETLNYRFYMKHPILRLDSDRLLIPHKYHRVIEDMTTADLLEWAGSQIPSRLQVRIVEGKTQVINDSEDSSLENNVPSDTGVGTLYGLFDNNLDQDFVGRY